MDSYLDIWQESMWDNYDNDISRTLHPQFQVKRQIISSRWRYCQGETGCPNSVLHDYEGKPTIPIFLASTTTKVKRQSEYHWCFLENLRWSYLSACELKCQSNRFLLTVEIPNTLSQMGNLMHQTDNCPRKTSTSIRKYIPTWMKFSKNLQYIYH